MIDNIFLFVAALIVVWNVRTGIKYWKAGAQIFAGISWGLAAYIVKVFTVG